MLAAAGLEDADAAGGGAEVGEVQLFARGGDEGALNHILQLPDIAGPCVGLEAVQGFRVRGGRHRQVQLAAFLGQEIVEQRGDVFAALTQWREREWKYVQPEEEVFTKTPLPHAFGDVAVSGGDDAYLRMQRLGSADAFKLLLLQDTEQFDLRLWGEFPDLIEKDGAAMGALETAIVL